MSLASFGSEGPWASAVFYAESPRGIIFLSSPDTRHSRNLASDARVAATIHDDTSDWRAVKGLQISGSVERIEGAAVDEVRGLYAGKFPIAKRIGNAPAAIAAAFDRIAWYVLTPSLILFVDNECGFGYREQVPAEILRDS